MLPRDRTRLPSQLERLSCQYGMRFDLLRTTIEHLTGESFLAKNTGNGEHPSPMEIARLAYEFYERRGRKPGNDLDDWLRAEQELRRHFA